MKNYQKVLKKIKIQIKIYGGNRMSTLLEKAFNEIKKLPETEQNIFAKWILEELEAERKWDKLFAESEDILEKLAEEALKEHKEGKTEVLDFNKL